MSLIYYIIVNFILHLVLSGLNCDHIFNNGRRSYLVCIVHAYLYLLIYCLGVYTLCILIRVGVKYSTCSWYLYLSTYLSVLDVLEYLVYGNAKVLVLDQKVLGTYK